MTSKDCKVPVTLVVVGGGLSSLVCIRKLKQLHSNSNSNSNSNVDMNIIIIESENRLGGRMYSESGLY